MRGKRNRFRLIEYSSGYAVEDRITGEEHWMSDGVDAIFHESGRPYSPGTKAFDREMTRALNDSPDETLEAYFYETWKKENAEWEAEKAEERRLTRDR